MTMIERAAKAMLSDWGESDAFREHRLEWSRDKARAALLAALDFSDDRRAYDMLVQALAFADDGHPEGLKYHEQAKAALLALRSLAQGDSQ